MPTSEIVPVYKITRPDRTTHGGYRWPISDWQTFPGTGPLCGPGWAHFYLSPQLAVLLNPIHAAYDPLTLWAAEGIIGARDHELKVGCSRARLVREIPLPLITLEQGVTFALWCALAVYEDAGFTSWAENWLSRRDRTREAAAAAARSAAETAAWVGEGWTAEAAAWATEARAARSAAQAAAWTAWVTEARAEAWAGERWAAEAAAAAARSAEAAAAASSRLNLMELAATALLPWDPAPTEIKEK